MERKIYTEVITKKLKSFDFKWFFHNAYIYLFLKIEKYLKTGYSTPPLSMGIAVTKNCNLRCPMCVLPIKYAQNPKEIDTEILKKVIDNLHDLGVGGIAISGGEPTIRTDVFELISYAKKCGTIVTLNSNLMLLTDERIEKMLQDPPHNINFSIDSPLPEINDKLRGGKNVLEKVLERVSKLDFYRKKTGKKFSMTAVTTLSNLNLDDLELLFEKVSKACADRICFIPLHDIEKGKTFIVKSSKIKPDFYDKLLQLSKKFGLPLENSGKYLKSFYNIMTIGVMPESCNAGYTHMVIDNELKLYRCIPHMNMGKFLFEWDPSKQTLKKLWNDPKWRKDRIEALKCKECFWDCHAELTFLVPM